MNATPHRESRRRRLFVTAAALALVMASACGKPPQWPPVAVEPDLGHDACAHCRMIVSDERFAAQYHDRAGGVEFFDDLGCLLAAHAGEGGGSGDPQALFVRSFDDARWLRGDEGFVVHAAAFTSPMGFGFAAFATRADAEAEARGRQGATVVELATLIRRGAAAASVAAAGLPAGLQEDHP
jgi:copper chaperone NosL